VCVFPAIKFTLFYWRASEYHPPTLKQPSDFFSKHLTHNRHLVLMY
jgi:hypothetical protein